MKTHRKHSMQLIGCLPVLDIRCEANSLHGMFQASKLKAFIVAVHVIQVITVVLCQQKETSAPYK